ncbi:ABC transporter ATP-binding protein [Pseudoflavonifractor phocaeensis]|uniref:ABC transporter ATP-binding protein n=1 Tax=Pseudoflavonifractor phocaeensis TaxID=1870988 RepID=UPI001F31B291|nr:ABC transporter ATP-binding protein [Pseudoflavonifractor phocaeensis]MCF2597048.1 ABC transporter ATP-binding protein [Pseudoflavonifractor phocaeensis]
MEEILTVTDLTRVYGKGTAATRALGGVSLSLEAGEFVGVMGPSGSGKTTLLNCVSTIDRPTSGSIVIDGKELTGLTGRELSRFRRERLGFIFQDCNLLDTLTAFENIALSLSIVRAPAGEIEGRVKEMANLLGISDCLDKYPYQMSGGQQQRCAAARAMVTRPALVLADEPTGALDSRSSKLLLDRLEELNREMGATILMVTHDAFTASCCRRVVFLRDGRIFLELRREGEDRRAFFRKIIRVVSEMGGEMADVL